MTGIGQRIRERRQEKGLALQALADRAGISKTYLWEIEHGKATNPGGAILTKLATCLETSIDFLAKGEEYAATEMTIPGSLARMADETGISFREAYALLKVSKTLEQVSSQFQLKPVQWDWRLLYERTKEFL